MKSVVYKYGIHDEERHSVLISATSNTLNSFSNSASALSKTINNGVKHENLFGVVRVAAAGKRLYFKELFVRKGIG